MKLRIRGNSIRLRVTQSEVAKLIAGDAVEETTVIGDAQFGYALIPQNADSADDASAGSSSDGASLVAASLTTLDGSTQLRVTLSAAYARAWGESNEVGITADVDALSVLIEKDFACLDPRDGVEDSDTFPNPKAN